MTPSDDPQPYAFTGEPPVAPPLPGETVASRTIDELLDRIAGDLVNQAMQCVRRFGDFHVALTGAAHLEPLYLRLMYDPNCRALPWRRTHLWLAVECPGNDNGGFGTIADTIVAHAGIPDDQVHPIPADTPTAAAQYESSLRDALAWREKGHDRIDYALLSLGANGAVAGLVPRDGALGDESRLVCCGAPPGTADPGPVTMTLPMLNACRMVAVVALGAEAADVVRGLSSGDAVLPATPAAGLAPHEGELKWYIDAAACGEEPA